LSNVAFFFFDGHRGREKTLHLNFILYKAPSKAVLYRGKEKKRLRA
jgi:hypothetical protein